MSSGKSQIVHSELSHSFTLDAVTVEVRIFRYDDVQSWTLEVISDSGMATLWDDEFAHEGDALAAFHATVQDEGMRTFLEDGDTRTIH